jgi:hypothetical protein
VTLYQIADTGRPLSLVKSASTFTLSGAALAASPRVYIEAIRKGASGNANTIASSGGTLAIGGSVARLAGGTDTTLTF